MAEGDHRLLPAAPTETDQTLNPTPTPANPTPANPTSANPTPNPANLDPVDPDADLLYRKIDPSSPYYLGSNDNPGNLISTVKLTAGNYEQWARSMRLSLRGRRKFGFVDGTIRRPVNPVYLADWEAVQSTLVQWIMNTIDESQKNMIPYFEEARPLWELLERRFTVTDGQRQQELKYELAECKQTNSMSVATYFGKLQKVWAELDKYNPVPACICGMSEEFQKKRDDAKFHDFLFGINQEKFGNIRSQLLAQKPLPTLDWAFNAMSQEERLQQRHNSIKSDPSEVMTYAMYQKFVEEVMALVELDSLRHALVGLQGSTGLSTEQRKRLTIAVELVANPSFIFMDEPTSGLDARAAAIVMRAVRNTVDTGRTVVCTIHQPSSEIFEAFDELLLLKRGGQVIYGGKLGEKSQTLIDYFQSIPGIPDIRNGDNPATWMLEISTPAAEERIGEDFANLYKNSEQYKEVETSIENLSVTPTDSTPLKFKSTYTQSGLSQFRMCLRKQSMVYLRSPTYNVPRLLSTTLSAFIIGSMFWDVGSKRDTYQNLFVVMGALYSSVIFLGVNNSSSVQPIISIERTVFYREKAAGKYSLLPYALAQGLVEIPYIMVQTVIYCLITYFMINFERNVGKFFMYLLFMFLTFTYFTFYGMMVVGLSPNLNFAAIVSSVCYLLWNLLSGFIVPKPNIPKGWLWFYYICPTAWTLKGIITSQFGDVETSIVGTEFNGTVKEFLEVGFGFKADMVGITVAVLIVFSCIFFTVFALSMKVFNFQKR